MQGGRGMSVWSFSGFERALCRIFLESRLNCIVMERNVHPIGYRENEMKFRCMRNLFCV